MLLPDGDGWNCKYSSNHPANETAGYLLRGKVHLTLVNSIEKSNVCVLTKRLTSRGHDDNHDEYRLVTVSVGRRIGC